MPNNSHAIYHYISLYFIIALLQRLRHITGERSTASISGVNYHRRENPSANKKFSHSNSQHNHDTYFNLTLGGRHTPATQASTTDIIDRNVLLKDNAKISATRHTFHITEIQGTSDSRYDCLNADVMHCEPKGQSPTPHKDRYIPEYENQNMACNASFCPESIKQSINSGENQLSRQCGEEKTNTRWKPTYVQYKFPQITAQKQSSSAEIIL